MVYCVAYDIVNDKVRRQVVKLCKQTGLMRIQKSIFIGKTESFRIKNLENEVKAMIDSKRDRFLIAPFDNLAFQQLQFLGFQPDKKLLAHEIQVMFF